MSGIDMDLAVLAGNSSLTLTGCFAVEEKPHVV